MSDLNLTSLTSSTPAPASSELTELREQCAELRALTQNLRLALLIVAVAVAGFFWVEARRNGQALETMRPQAAQIAEVTKKQAPAITDFINRLIEYSRTHADFVPILTKHNIRTTSAAATPAIPTAVAPKSAAPAAAPKK